MHRSSFGYQGSQGHSETIIIAGKDPNVSVVEGMIQSWYDAPDSFSEELSESVAHLKNAFKKLW